MRFKAVTTCVGVYSGCGNHYRLVIRWHMQHGDVPILHFHIIRMGGGPRHILSRVFGKYFWRQAQRASLSDFQRTRGHVVFTVEQLDAFHGLGVVGNLLGPPVCARLGQCPDRAGKPLVR